jgi:hypothetical protein
MPNGESKNWIRMCAAIDGFRAKYNSWPKTVRVFDFFPSELKRVLSENDHTKLQSKIDIVGDNSLFIAVDETGNSYSYGDEGFSKKEPDIRAEDWLGVSPDYYD